MNVYEEVEPTILIMCIEELKEKWACELTCLYVYNATQFVSQYKYGCLTLVGGGVIWGPKCCIWQCFDDRWSPVYA